MRFKWNWKKNVIFHVSSRKVNLKIYLHQRGQFLDLSGRMGMKISTNTSIQMQVIPFLNINIFQTLFKLNKNNIFHSLDKGLLFADVLFFDKYLKGL